MTFAKPPAQVMAPAGFNAHKGMGDIGDHALDPAFVRRLSTLPPFQAFVVSREAPPEGYKADVYAYERAYAAIVYMGAEAFIGEYERWHKASGKWPNETPYGEPL